MRVKLLMQNSQKGQGLLFLIIGVLVAASFLLVNGLPSTKLEQFGTSSAPPATSMQETTDKNLENNLQLKTMAPIISSITPSPSTLTPPSTACVSHSYNTDESCTCPSTEQTILCRNYQCVSETLNGSSPSGNGCDETGSTTCRYLMPGGNGKYCNLKPVIYLYPTKDILVNVKLDIPGQVTISDPLYPTQTGWQNILAHPNGSLEYQGKTYHELFYESSVTKKVAPPQQGVVVAKKDVEPELRFLTTRLGLLPAEQKELVDFWTPRLTALNSPYVFISVWTAKDKDAVDKIIISPRPDTFIQMLFYFKGVSNPSRDTGGTRDTFDSLQPPVRRGFTAVEWGGTIDQN